MGIDHQFDHMVAGLRAGDPAAVRACVEMYEPEIRRAARVRLRDPRLRRLVDSIDISQSVFRRFLTRCQDGAYVIDRPEQLLALLVTMTRNRVTDWARKREVESHLSYSDWMVGEADRQPASREDDPKALLERHELAEIVREKMSSLEYTLFIARAEGESWESIGRSLDQSPEALRKRLHRGLIRIRAELRDELAQYEGGINNE